MPVIISMLRGVNVGAHNRIKMDALRALYESLGFEQPRTFIQSGNVIFRTKQKSTPQLAKKIQAAIGGKLGCSPEVILRSSEEMRQAIAANPFADRKGIDPAKLLITFLTAEPHADAKQKLSTLKPHPEEIHLIGREMYIYFPDGAGKSKLQWSQVEKMTKVQGTARNLNSVTKMLAIAEELEAA